MNARILVTDDDIVTCRLFSKVLEEEGYHVECVQTGDDALTRLQQDAYDLLVVDIRMSGMTGIEVTRTVRKQYPEVPIVVMTAFGSMETAIEAIREGAFDYLAKPFHLEELKSVVARALAAPERWRPAPEDGEGEVEPAPLGTVIGKSAAMVAVYKTVARVAPTKSTVLIYGESGTGKELIARAMHQHSPRASRPFVAVDCGVLTETLLESELFGHVRGAFTGAVTEKKGVFEEAHGGTCFLDEIGDISPTMQAKLLRVLQEHEVRRVGGKDWIKVDVRVVAATHRRLAELVKEHTFRHDLYYRLNVITLQLPPLRERTDDIPALAYHFLQQYSHENGKTVMRITDEAMGRLQAYPWPGNIRELENAIARGVAFTRQSILTLEDLPTEIRAGSALCEAHDCTRDDRSLFAATPTLEEMNKRYVQYVVGKTQGNMTHAAKILNIDRRSLYRMLARFKIQPFCKEQ